jgi:hypothetical protein
MSLQRDEYPYYELPDIARYWQAQVDAERGFARAHANCDAPWICETCERQVCPRCEPSPGEFENCVECDWFADDDPITEED